MLQLARAVVAAGQKAALVVNEAGQVPVDGKLLSVGGLPVKEIFAGCICCSVVGDFIETLRALRQDPELTYILVEPSGMADAPRLFESLQKHVEAVTKLMILDAPRLPLLLKAAGRLIRGQGEAADVVLLNKMDAMDSQQARETAALVSGLRLRAPLHEVSAAAGLPRSLLDEIMQ
jgi:G3E family GTPase